MLGLTAAEAETLRHASLLHDVGKIAVPDAILTKPGKLTDEEWVVMRRHAEAGAASSRARARRSCAWPRRSRSPTTSAGTAAAIRRACAGEAIPLVGRICAVCDVFDALLSPRPYKEPWPVQDALDELRRERGKHFDPAVVDAFMTLVDDLDPLLLDERREQETSV